MPVRIIEQVRIIRILIAISFRRGSANLISIANHPESRCLAPRGRTQRWRGASISGREVRRGRIGIGGSRATTAWPIRCGRRGTRGGGKHSAKVNSRLSEQFAAAGERANDPRCSRESVTRATRGRGLLSPPVRLLNAATADHPDPRGAHVSGRSIQLKKRGIERERREPRAGPRPPAESTMNPDRRGVEPRRRAW